MILNRKKRKQALLRILACQIIATAEIKDVDSHAKITENLSDLTYYVGGINGMKTVRDELERYFNGDCAGCDECEVNENEREQRA